MSARTLYLCYFGLREPLVQTQVLPYLRELTAGGVEVYMLTFEQDPAAKWTPEAVREWTERLRADGIHWQYRTYHKRPTVPATLFDVGVGAWTAGRLAKRHDISVFHARSHVAAFMGLLARRFSGGRLIFDIRGLLPEEYVDAGSWPKDGWIYRTVKRAEARILSGADGFIVLTERARELLFGTTPDGRSHGRPVEVIPCCVDLQRFEAARDLDREKLRNELGVAGRRVMVYVGALGGWYLTEEMAEFLAVAHRQDPSTFSMVLTQSDPELVLGPLKRHGVAERDCLVRSVPPAEIPRFLKAADVALSFIKPCYSKLASSPTKMAEYLASGLPVVCNTGIGDVDQVVRDDRIGVLLDEFTPEAYLHALEGVTQLMRDPDLADRCRASARDRFDLKQVGGTRYRRLYQRLLGEKTAETEAQSWR